MNIPHKLHIAKKQIPKNTYLLLIVWV